MAMIGVCVEAVCLPASRAFEVVLKAVSGPLSVEQIREWAGGVYQ